MIDGIYQSVICFFTGYLLFSPATFVAPSGRGVGDRSRMGVFIACGTVAVVNLYVLLNTYRWDWLMVLVVFVSTLLIWLETGIYSSFRASFQFYQSAAQVYGTLAFWLLTLVTIVLCLLPRFSAKFFQKTFRPLDVDIIREQVRQGKFDYLDKPERTQDKSRSSSESSADAKVPDKAKGKALTSMTESERPIYPPSEATSKIQHVRNQTGSEGTDRTRPSIDVFPPTPGRPISGPVRSSFDRSRQSMDRLRPSFEVSRDMTSASLLHRVESSHSNSQGPNQSSYPVTPVISRMNDITSELQ
jgi:phospholipid-translocating ATPase